MLLTENELTIRNASAADAHTLGEWWRDGRVMAHAGFPLGLDETDEEIAESLSHDSEDRRRRLIIELDGEPIGEMSYSILEDGTAEIGIKICREDKQEKGYGRRLLRMLIRELFRRGAPKIILDTNLKNTRAQHVYETLGFRKTSVDVDAWTDQLGVPQTAVNYELLPGELR